MPAATHSALPPLMLGTVQLGMPYGLGAARTGLDEAAAQAILDGATARGIRALDTARAYGEAEARIGRWLARRGGAPTPLIVSKFPPLGGAGAPAAVEAALDESLRQLGVGSVDLYLAHHGADLLRPGVCDTLRACATAGKIGAFGASVYEHEEAKALLGVTGLAALQLPLHLANTAAAESGLLEEARRRRVAIVARSVFLQGLLLSDPHALDPFFAGAAGALARLDELARRAGTTRAALALAAVRAMPGVVSIVVGVDTVAQLADTVAAHETPPDPAAVAAALAIGRGFPPELADPRRWPR